MQYPMKKKTERPLFNYLVRVNSSFDYYLYENLNDAIEKARQLSRDDIGVLFEVYFNTQTREFFGQKTFLVFDGEIHYEKHGPVELHIEFYVHAGEWLNPDEKMIEKIK